MIEPEWIEPDLAELFHSEQLAEHGGREGMRDLGRLEAAMSRPRNLFAYETADLFRLAASYAHGIAAGHPFIDGNKRTSFVVSVTFLALNGVRISAQPHESFWAWTQLASGSMTEPEVADWLRAHAGLEAP